MFASPGLFPNFLRLRHEVPITHLVRPEDWPVMNVHTIGFSSVPFGFFDKNPAATTKTTTPERPKVIVMDKPVPPDFTKCVPLPLEKSAMMEPKPKRTKG